MSPIGWCGGVTPPGPDTVTPARHSYILETCRRLEMLERSKNKMSPRQISDISEIIICSLAVGWLKSPPSSLPRSPEGAEVTRALKPLSLLEPYHLPLFHPSNIFSSGILLVYQNPDKRKTLFSYEGNGEERGNGCHMDSDSWFLQSALLVSKSGEGGGGTWRPKIGLSTLNHPTQCSSFTMETNGSVLKPFKKAVVHHLDLKDTTCIFLYILSIGITTCSATTV